MGLVGAIEYLLETLNEDFEVMETTWASDTENFWGTIRQLTTCARCGEPLKGRHDEPKRVADVFKPSVHFLCEDCYSKLPEAVNVGNGMFGQQGIFPNLFSGNQAFGGSGNITGAGGFTDGGFFSGV